MRIILSGASGKMGKAVTARVTTEKDSEIVCGIDKYDDGQATYPIFPSIELADIPADVIIDFSNPVLLPDILKYATDKRIPVVIATTGLSVDDQNLIKKAAEKIAVFSSGNMSLGINLMQSLIAKAVKVLGSDFDVEIIEKHHNQKIDAPSGTALMLAASAAEAMNKKPTYVYDRHAVREKRSENEIGIHSIRGGNIIGEHQVIFAGTDEIIEIKHTASSKAIFVSGALAAAKFIIKMPKGLYNMNDMIK